jgi:pimeloyl-ACP methyl ester carboxylesterase
MYLGWLDGWDERRARRGDKDKRASDFVLDAGLVFEGVDQTVSVEDFCLHADQALLDPTFFDEPNLTATGFEKGDGWLRFRSPIVTDIEENNVVWVKITEGRSLNQAVVVFHHWNARSRQRQLSKLLAWRGITVFEIAMPYHFERSRPGAAYADYMLGPNLGRTIQSVRQAVLDGKRLTGWLKGEGYRDVSVLGMSLGSWVAGLVAAHDPAVTKASLFLTAGSLADMVWSGRATRQIRESLEPAITQSSLNRAWGGLNMENFAANLARPDLDLQLVLARRDKVVLPELSERFLVRLAEAGAHPDILRLNCGHYSLALAPYIAAVGWSLLHFLKR